MTKFYILNLLFIFIRLIIILILSLCFFSHPITIIILIIIYAIITTLNISMWKPNFIYSILIFLIIIRGLFIIFLYFSCLISNEKINFFINFPILIKSLILSTLIIFILINNNSVLELTRPTTKEINSLFNLNEKKLTNITNIYNYPFNNITILRIIFLLLSLFTIIKISSIKSMSLRKLNYEKNYTYLKAINYDSSCTYKY
jgi:hypothetical protein